MALNIGFNCAKEIINSSMGSSYDTVATYWRTNPADDIGYLLSGYPRNFKSKPTTPEMYWYAAFSTATMTELATNAPPTAVMTNRATVDNQSMFSNTISNLMANLTNFGANGSTNIELIGHTTNSPRLSPPVGWMTIKQPVRTTPGKTNTVSTPVMRIAFFTEDLSGLIDAERMCGATSRDTGTDPKEISMANIGTKGITFATDADIRATYLSPFLLATNGGIATTNLRYFATGLRSWSNAFQRIPRSIAIGTTNCYGGACNPTNTNGAKFLIPTNLTANDVSTIATVLTTNLPNFGARGGAMNATAYISNIAANIVDYVDKDSTPTVDTDTNNAIPTWRGVEAIAWPNEVFTHIHFSNRVTKAPNYEFEVIVKNSLEVWNLSSTSIVVNGADYSISNNLDINLKCSNWYGNLKSVDSAKGPINEVCTNVFTLPPNSYGVLSAPSRNLKFNVPIALAPGTNVGLTIHGLTPNSNNKYTISYSNKIIEAIPAGRWSPQQTNLSVSNSCLFANPVNFGTSAGGGAYNLAGGDPRGGLFIQKPAMDFNLNETTPGGRNSHASSSGGAKIVDPPVNWPDGGHSSTTDTVSAPTSTTVPQGLQKQGNTNHWVQKINNSGSMTNIMELGNIFDPLQWGDPKNPFHPRDTAAWIGLSNSATPFSGACGRTTLRIGRPEHQRFTWTNVSGQAQPNMQASAAALLDIFCADTSTDANISGRFDDGNQININTAPPRVLRALAAGIILTNDPAMKPSNNYLIPSNAITAFNHIG